MKKIHILIFLATSIFSCTNPSLKEEYLLLKKENQALKRQLKKTEYEKLLNSELILMPNNYNLGDKNVVTGFFYQKKDIYPKFELFFVDEDFNKKEKIAFVSLENNEFEFEYTPMTKSDNLIRVLAMFDLDSIKVSFPSETILIPD